MQIREQVHLAEFTTFRLGGRARYFVDVVSVGELQDAIAFSVAERVPYFILAGGSNVLFSDDGFDGLVIHIAASDVQYKGTQVVADAGANLAETIKAAAERQLGGWESMCGIPGTIGGAVRGNAGAFGTEIQGVLTNATALDSTTGEVRIFTNTECEFAYRTSFFKKNSEWMILSATFALAKAETSREPTTKCAETLAEREKRHLQTARCAGSFFKNPIGTPEAIAQFESEKDVASKGGKVPAGWLIDKCGLKGTQVGGAQCSPQHPNYLVNTGGATAQDVLELSRLIKQAVQEKFGIDLEEEVTIV